MPAGLRPSQMSEVTSSSREGFWRFSLIAYKRPGVAEACLDLQDQFGFDVNLLLFCCFVAHEQQRSLDLAELGRLRDAISPLNEELVWRLRKARRWIKSSRAEHRLDPEIADPLRNQILRAELQAEQLVQFRIVQLGLDEPRQMTRRAGDPAQLALASLRSYADLLATDDMSPRLESLIALIF